MLSLMGQGQLAKLDKLGKLATFACWKEFRKTAIINDR